MAAATIKPIAITMLVGMGGSGLSPRSEEPSVDSVVDTSSTTLIEGYLPGYFVKGCPHIITIENR